MIDSILYYDFLALNPAVIAINIGRRLCKDGEFDVRTGTLPTVEGSTVGWKHWGAQDIRQPV